MNSKGLNIHEAATDSSVLLAAGPPNGNVSIKMEEQKEEGEEKEEEEKERTRKSAGRVGRHCGRPVRSMTHSFIEGACGHLDTVHIFLLIQNVTE